MLRENMNEQLNFIPQRMNEHFILIDPKGDTAGYVRLSDDDKGGREESNSISNQKIIVTKASQKYNKRLYGIYIDDGYSGTNFSRPGFKLMIQEVYAGKIKTVIVKDLSRFGRDYIQTGNYISKIFVDLDVRFIAESDCVDSFYGIDPLLVPIKNVINSAYAEDVSRKSREGKRTSAETGKYVALAPYGYKKDPNNLYTLCIDEIAAQTVRLIFNMYVAGYGMQHIVNVLRNRNILCPSAYLMRNTRMKVLGRKDTDWTIATIRHILKNRAYIGDLVYGKSECKGIRTNKRTKKDEKDWFIIENHHPAIIDRALYFKAHEMIVQKRRVTKKGQSHIFSGIVKCADCGYGLTLSSAKNREPWFTCWRHKDDTSYCSSHYIRYNDLYEVVLENLKKQIYLAKKDENKYVEILLRKNNIKSEKDKDNLQQEIDNLEKRKIQIQKFDLKLFEEHAMELIDDETYRERKNLYKEETEEIKKRIECCQKNLELDSEIDAAKFILKVRAITELKELDFDIVNTFIKRIDVYEATLDKGQRIQKIKIIYNFIGEGIKTDDIQGYIETVA